MRKRNWSVAFRPHPSPDGLDRLGMAVRLMLERGLAKRPMRVRQGRRVDVATVDARSEVHQ